MVDDQDQQPTDEAQVGTEAPSAQTAPRRRRRAASRPAGPPVIPESDQAELFAAPAPPGDEPAAEADAEALAEAQSEVEAELTAAGEAEAGLVDSPEEEVAEATEPANVEPESPAPTDAAATTARRSRRATRGVTTVAFSAEPEPEATPVVAPAEVPVAALFQPPDETKAVRRRRRPAVDPDAAGAEAVSYTHLTLPTTILV